MEKIEQIKKYIFILVVAVLIILSFLIIREFFVAIITSYILSFLIKPVYDIFSKKMQKKFAAIICIAIILAVFVIPISIILIILFQQLDYSINITSLSQTLGEKISSLPLLGSINAEALIEQSLSYIFSIIKSTILELPYLAISILITIFGIYYILINWDFLATHLKKYLPFKDKDATAREIASSTKALVYGYFLIAFIEFIVASTGFYIAGINYPLLLAAIIAIFAFVPGVGPGVVWIPTAAYQLIQGNIYTAVVVLITGLVISIFIETFLYVKILGKRAQINPLILLVGIFGGVPLFGIFGFIVGPLILIYTIKLLEEAITSKED